MSTSRGWEGKGKYGSFRFADETQGVQVKLSYPLTVPDLTLPGRPHQKLPPILHPAIS